MLISVYEFLAILQETCAPTSPPNGVQIPSMFASMQIFVFEEEGVREVFNPFWWEYLACYRAERNQPLENNARRGICDEITERCGSHFSEAARKLMGDVDCSAGAKFTRLFIPAGVSLNDVPGPGGHQPLVIATHPRGKTELKDVTLRIYEPQNRQDCRLADAIALGVVVRDVWV